MQNDILIRTMQQADLPAVVAIQAEAYNGYFLESPSVLKARLAVAADTAWVAESNNQVQAYLVAYRTVPAVVTPLNTVFDVKPAGSCLYLHDLAVSANLAGRGIGPRLVQHALHSATLSGCEHSALVSVQDSKAFWQRLGYIEAALTQEQQNAVFQALASYGSGAVYMSQQLNQL